MYYACLEMFYSNIHKQNAKTEKINPVLPFLIPCSTDSCSSQTCLPLPLPQTEQKPREAIKFYPIFMLLILPQENH